ncbi:MAG: ATP/GTP-binding protein [Pseudobdellovibrio sp.]
MQDTDSAKLIVITGGPGAGKTALLEFLRKDLPEQVAVLPEAASILFGGGFWRLTSDTGKIAAQKCIYHIQNEMQTMIIAEKKWNMALCDRGTLDGIAYWPGEAHEFCKQLNTSIEAEYSKYTAVIHLCSPTKKNGYNHQNPIRIETAAEAGVIDQRIHSVWKDHPHYNRIESTKDFIEKVHRAVLLIRGYIPE